MTARPVVFLVLGLVLALVQLSAALPAEPPRDVWVVELEGRERALLLEPGAFLAPDLVPRDAEGRPVDGWTSLETWSGRLADDPASAARLVSWRGEVQGILLMDDTVVPLAEESAGRLAPAPLDLPGDMEDYLEGDVLTGLVDDGETQCRGLASGKRADPSGLLTGWSPRTFEVAIALDAAAVTKAGPAWPAKVGLILGAVDALYERDLQLSLQVVDMHAHDAGVFTDPSGTGGLVQLGAHYSTSHADLSREAVHRFTGWDMTDAAGMARCIGAAGNMSIAYSWSEYRGTVPDRPFWVTPIDVVFTGHELGHLLRAEHHLANCVEPRNVAGLAERCTLMFPVADPNTARISVANRLYMRGYIETHGI